MLQQFACVVLCSSPASHCHRRHRHPAVPSKYKVPFAASGTSHRSPAPDRLQDHHAPAVASVSFRPSSHPQPSPVERRIRRRQRPLSHQHRVPRRPATIPVSPPLPNTPRCPHPASPPAMSQHARQVHLPATPREPPRPDHRRRHLPSPGSQSGLQVDVPRVAPRQRRVRVDRHRRPPTTRLPSLANRRRRRRPVDMFSVRRSR